MTDPVPFSERGDDDSVDDLLAIIQDAINPVDNAEELVEELVGAVMQNIENMGVLGNFVFIGEVVDANAQSTLMVVTSDNLPDWIARGMMMTAEEYIIGGLTE